KRRRPNEQREDELMEALQQQFEETLSLRIQTCLEKGDDLEQLKESCLNEKRLPRGVVTGSEKRINAKAAELENYDELTEVVRLRSESLASTVSMAKPSEETELMRTCSASLASLIRKDLPEGIRTAFLDTIERTLISATDYVVEYSMQRAAKDVRMPHSPTPATDDEDEAEMRLEIAVDTNRITDEVATVVDEVTSDSTDTTRRRLKILGGVIKSMLFEKRDKVINEGEVSNALPGSEQKELQVCVRTINFLKPYIPEKNNYYTMSHQLPFFLMANDILHATGYSKFTLK
ncbi:hypothetical protein CU097_002873, partial [Rhizopus azygosporus]